MRCASALSTLPDSEAAARGVLERVADGLGGEPADLAVVFASAHHRNALASLAGSIRARGLGRHVLGCTGESIVGDGHEIEGEPALSLWSIRMPGVSLRPIRPEFDGERVVGWPSELAPADGGRTLLFLADPFTFPADDWLKQVNAAAKLPVVGGMASASQAPGGNRLVLDDRVYDDGAVAILVEGPLTIRTIVSQGCRPIGRPMIVTKSDGSIIRELGRRPALEVLREQFAGLEPEDQERVQQGLHIGRVINEYQESFQRGDFLVRNVLGADDEGGIAITDTARVGQTVQFHVRDAETADEDLRTLLRADRKEGGPVVGALLFTCNGRGSRLFDEPDHDVGAIRGLLGPIPVAGFFAMGEVGPIGGQNFLHGFTASVALFEERPKAR